MDKIGKFLLPIILIAVVGAGAYVLWAKQSSKADLIRVARPEANSIVASPLLVEGQARGYWFFEASFPVRLLDDKGNELALGIAQAQDEWMTTEFVPFSLVLTFTAPQTNEGVLVLHKDNPSGLPEHDDELRVPVRFR